jgi:hypothetical protein
VGVRPRAAGPNAETPGKVHILSDDPTEAPEETVVVEQRARF